MSKGQGQLYNTIAGVGLECGLLAIWLIGWHYLSDAAGWFAPATALVGLTLWLLSFLYFWPRLKLALKTAGWVAIGLAIAASLSLGTFLPPKVAEWISPALGKFGGGVALGLIAVGLAVAIFGGLLEARPGLLDLAVGCGLAAVWVGSQVDIQARFPTPPTDATLLTPRFDLIFWIALALTILTVGFIPTWMQALYYYLGIGNLGRRNTPSKPEIKIKQLIWRWAAFLTGLGLIASLGLGAAGWWRFGLLGLGLTGGGIMASWPWSKAALPRKVLRATGWLIGSLIATIITYFSTTEDLEMTLLRNTLEYHTLQFWRSTTGDDRFEIRPNGTLTGRVSDEAGRPIAGAAVVVSSLTGQTFSAYTNPQGLYNLPDVPVGNYLPMAISPDHQPGAVNRFGGRVATVRPAQTAQGVDFVLQPKLILTFKPNDTLRVAPPTEISKDNPEPSLALRRSFTFENRGKLLDGGLIHEPPVSMGSGPFPILLIIYPGPASSWENVSVPLAAKGFVVVSFFPNRLLDLEGDLDDLNLLTAFVVNGKLSARGDTKNIALVGGSVSTAYTYVMARTVAGSQVQSNFKAAINYGGLIDLYRLRYAWERGQVIIDPGISELEYLLIGFGRPDTRPELYLRFSPYFALKRSSLPPTLLVHVNKDIIVPVEQSQTANDLFTRLGLPHELLLYPELEHYLDISKRDPAYTDMLNQTIKFLNRQWSP